MNKRKLASHTAAATLILTLILVLSPLAWAQDFAGGDCPTETGQSPVSPDQTAAEATASAPPAQETTAPSLSAEETTAPTPPAEETTAPTLPAEETIASTPPAEETTAPLDSTMPHSQPLQDNSTLSQVLTVEQVLALDAGDSAVVVEGTVVFAGGSQIVLQDDTGGIRVCFSDVVPLSLGDVIQVLGYPSGSFSAVSWEPVGTAPLPAVPATLADAPENLRISLQQVTLEGSILTQGAQSISFSYSGVLPVSNAVTADVWGVLMNQCFFIDTVSLTSSSDTPPAEAPQTPSASQGVYFGLLHAHSGLTDGGGSVSEVFSSAAQVPGLDFFAVTDHSGAFDNADAGDISADGASLSARWAEGQAAAAAVTNDRFVGLYGYEITWPSIQSVGHISTFNTPGWEAVTGDPIPSFADYCTELTRVPDSLSQFNHPDPGYGAFGNFSDYSPLWDQLIPLLEVGWTGTITGEAAYVQALDQGWHPAPTVSAASLPGTQAGEAPCRTGVLADTLTPQGLYDAIRNRRVYATEDSDLAVTFRVNGQAMGSFLSPSDSLTLEVQLSDPTDGPAGRVQVIADGGTPVAELSAGADGALLTQTLPAGYHYYYLRITQPDGDLAITAPVWIENYEDMGVTSFTADTDLLTVGKEATLSLTLYNREWAPLVLDSLELTANGTPVYEAENPGTVSDTLICQIPFSWQEPGTVSLQVRVSGTAAGQSRSFQAELELTCQPEQQLLSLSSIEQARQAAPGTCVQVRGYVTAGSSHPGNTFPDTLYIQDDTGAITVTGAIPAGIQVGCPVEITGVVSAAGGNPTLELADCVFLTDPFYRYTPDTLSIKTAMDYAVHGDALVQLEGTVVSADYTPDGAGVTRFVIQDIRGDQAAVVIEPYILSGSLGVNNLAQQVKVGQVVRAIGLCHRTEAGETVLRVRNCDEVVLVPPLPDSTNPKTGDFFTHLFCAD